MTQLSPTNIPNPELLPAPVQKFQFLRTNKRPILSFGGALIVGYFIAPLMFKSPVGSSPEEVLSTDSGFSIPASSVMTVSSTPSAVIPITGEVKLIATVTGKAPVGGAVARWLVEPGQKVEKGQGILEISSGEAVRPAPAAEVSQTRAEKAQINAANEQLELAQRLARAQSQLRAAKERVANAQEKVGQARQIIQRLQNGEDVVQPAQIRKRVVKRSVTPSQSVEHSPSPEELKAQASLKAAQRIADAARASQIQAEAEAKNAERAIATTKTAVKNAERRLALTEEAFADGRVSGADVHESRVAIDEANTAVKVAEARVEPAKREAENQQRNVTAALAHLDEAKKALAQAKSQSKTVIAAAPTPEIIEEVIEEVIPETSSAPASPISFAEASRMAQAALAESQAASREADRLTAQVETYRKQAHATNAEIRDASDSLLEAQQRVLDSVPRPRFTICSSPHSGTIVWISRMASEVGPGDNVFGIASDNKFKAMLKVNSPAWKTIKIGQLVSGSLGKTKQPSVANTLAPRVEGATYVPSANKEVSLNVKVTKIVPPTAPDEPATVEGDIDVLSGASSSLDNGKVLSVSLPANQKSGAIRVPASAVWEKDGRSFVVTLSPQPKAEPSPTLAPVTGTSSPQVTPSLEEPEGDNYLLKWKEVEVSAKIGNEKEIRGGVQLGTQIVSDILSLLPQIELDPKFTSPVTVTDI
jgi:multidrug efflux pump subunit AcrA (membrane-fusion protein)